MVTCPNCLYSENPEGALICEKCGNFLRPTLMKKPSTTVLAPANVDFAPRVREKHIGKLGRADVAIYVGESDMPIIVPLVKDLLLGRFSPGSAEPQAYVDLSSYNAMDQGVSRKHVMLRRLGTDIVAVDVESTNGTWLNGIRLTPNQPITLRSADRLLLARLALQVYFS